ncbi:uncharacterized protein FOMMEDRAFT_79434 [Fomitiporia mediterranea MF3/22]|uniref:uncharacterized protein n=1 Tax=Fomitiporia mediterranea (strain MF3/22) TaxID=694068 RepID=UPI0004407338|nr:uncharacterized protein FOMMEDRAFT_79434 [Fomitiporia mediterranea MF3/22]EJD06028.1 hypothetical protein FOMMEDRAFT_79434 [Fomitiporia mediterranea MF3/22]
MNPENDKLDTLREWSEPRFKADHRYIGLDLSPKGLFWCTSNGALGFSASESGKEGVPTFSPSFQKASLPVRLCDWKLSGDASSFAYGGDEVDLSVWDTTRAFETNLSPSEDSQSDRNFSYSKKRKRGDSLFPAEIWRAKNLPNDSLSLRQPIHITSLSYLSSNIASASTNVHLVTGTHTGDVRRYDTRAARRPVANWAGIGKVGGISVVQAGTSEHELFVADNGTNLSALDLRNGRTIYSYKKLQGAVTSLAPSSDGLLGSTCRDRFFRLHTTFPPPSVAGAQQEERGEVVGTLYMKSVPTAVVCCEEDVTKAKKGRSDNEDSEGEDGEDEDVWADMQDVGESDEEDGVRPKDKRRS